MSNAFINNRLPRTLKHGAYSALSHMISSKDTNKLELRGLLESCNKQPKNE